MWCDDCNRAWCRCGDEPCPSCFCFPCCCGALEEEYSAQRADEMAGWNAIWPPVPDDVWVRWAFYSVKSDHIVEARGKVQPWVIARWFTFPSMVEIETDTQVFTRNEDGNWKCMTYPPIPLL